jgi:hypothetical protein
MKLVLIPVTKPAIVVVAWERSTLKEALQGEAMRKRSGRTLLRNVALLREELGYKRSGTRMWEEHY